MRTVLFAAASTLCLVFAAHGAPASHRHAARHAAEIEAPQQAARALSSATPDSVSCIDGNASLSHAAYRPDEDAGPQRSDSCSQYLSTQILVPAPSIGHT